LNLNNRNRNHYQNESKKNLLVAGDKEVRSAFSHEYF